MPGIIGASGCRDSHMARSHPQARDESALITFDISRSTNVTPRRAEVSGVTDETVAVLLDVVDVTGPPVIIPIGLLQPAV